MNSENCARKAINLGASIGRLNLSLFGEDRIKDEIDVYAAVCDVNPHIIERQIDEGIEQYSNLNDSIGKEYFNLAVKNTYYLALDKIQKGGKL